MIRAIRPIILLAALLFASCEREPALFLCDHQTEGSGPVRIAADWTDFLRKETPTGMTVQLFSADNSTADSSWTSLQATTTNDITRADYSLKPARYAAYVFNQSSSEFGTLTFSNLDNWSKAEAQTIRTESKWYTEDKALSIENELGLATRSIGDEPVVTSVEWLGTGVDDNICLTQEMLDSAGGQRITIDTVHTRNVVYTVTVYVHIKNVGGLRNARASLEGLADGYLLGQHRTTGAKATQLIENWSLSIDSTGTRANDDGAAKTVKYGTIKGEIATLGLPYGHSGSPDENICHLEVRLTNDSILTFNYPVGDRFEWDTNDNADLHFTVDITMKDPLPDVPGSDDNPSAFEVTVEDWGEENNIPVAM